MDVLDRADLPFPHSLPEFQRLFPDDAARRESRSTLKTALASCAAASAARTPG